MEAEDVPARAVEAGKRLTAGLGAIDGVASVRGLGLLLAAELTEPIAKDVAARALAAGLVVNPVTESAIRVAPQLLVSEAEIDEAVAILASVLS
jgi:acetylornithine/succinyldiaminopimelate/putrescine aminotransferase